MTLPLTASPTHICVLRLSALGDVCNLIPAVRALQQQWPNARITWIVGGAEHSLLSGMDGVELVTYDKSTGLKGMYTLWRRFASIRFDILLHAQQSLRASMLSLGLKTRIRLGYDAQRAKDHQTWFTNHKLAPHPQAHVLSSFLDFARAIGVTPEKLTREALTWNIPIPAAAHEEAQAIIQGRRVMILSPCATPRRRNFRNWTASGYAAAIEHAYRQHGLITLLTGGTRPIEQEMVADIMEQCRQLRVQAGRGDDGAPISVLGKTSLKGLLAMIRQARVVIAPDSGPVHMANALGTPVLGLFATTNPDRAAPFLWRDYVVNRYPDAVRKYLGGTMETMVWGTRVRHPDAMALITVDDVTHHLDRLLAATAVRDESDRPLFGADIPPASPDIHDLPETHP